MATKTPPRPISQSRGPLWRQQEEADEAAGDGGDYCAVEHAARLQDLALDDHALAGFFALVGAAAVIGVFVDEVGGALQQQCADQRQQEEGQIKDAITQGDDAGQSHGHVTGGEDAWAQGLNPGAGSC